MTRRQFPISIQDFRTIREQEFYYVDKTSHIQRLVSQGQYYFMSRPQWFGKGLLVDTLRELFEGNEPLFRGLHIHDHWDWTIRHPVVRLSFDGKYNELEDVEHNILNQLIWIEEQARLELPEAPVQTGPERLQDILRRLHHTTGKRVVVLVDEYDKPILDVIDKPEMATANRDYLRGFYGIIKGSAEHVRFVFVTGISMFSRVSLFSGLNNLDNISLDKVRSADVGRGEKSMNRPPGGRPEEPGQADPDPELDHVPACGRQATKNGLQGGARGRIEQLVSHGYTLDLTTKIAWRERQGTP